MRITDTEHMRYAASDIVWPCLYDIILYCIFMSSPHLSIFSFGFSGQSQQDKSDDVESLSSDTSDDSGVSSSSTCSSTSIGSPKPVNSRQGRSRSKGGVTKFENAIHGANSSKAAHFADPSFKVSVIVTILQHGIRTELKWWRINL